MALDGGGGGGGPVGAANSFTGPAEALELIGGHCYAYSGDIEGPTATNPTTLLSFTTGNNYTVATFYGYYGQPKVNAENYTWILELNGSAVITTVQRTGSPVYSDLAFSEELFKCLIPPYTEVKLTATASASDSFNFGSSLIGRVYRTSD